jgi:hypothetical protein
MSKKTPAQYARELAGIEAEVRERYVVGLPFRIGMLAEFRRYYGPPPPYAPGSTALRDYCRGREEGRSIIRARALRKGSRR